MTKRGFIKGSLSVGALFCFPLKLEASSSFNESADGLMALQSDGKIHLYSGGGHMGLYAQDNMLDILTKLFDCGEEFFVIENGDNPNQLSNLLNQYSNHLSFSSIKTNKRAALALLNHMKIMAADYFSGEPKDINLKDGVLYNDHQHISLGQLATRAEAKFLMGDVCEKTRNMAHS